MQGNFVSNTRVQIAKDMAISIGGNIVPLAVLQFVVLPSLGSRVSDDQYGLVITLASFFSFCPATLGAVLNNILLIRISDYSKIGEEGDFSVLAIFAGGLSFASAIAYAATVAVLESGEYLALGFTALMFFLNAYWVVAFRIKLDYRKIFFANLALALGYVAGFAFFLVFRVWEIVYFFGQLCMLAYLIAKTEIWRIPPKRTRLFSSTAKDAALLTVSSFFARVSGYCDRMMLFPLMGGAAASVYYVSTLLAKVVGLLASSINNVVLSYLSKRTDVSSKSFWMTLTTGVAICLLCYGVVQVISLPMLSFLYPQFVDEASIYLPITSATAFISVLTGLVDPYVLRFRSTGWQLLFSGLSVTVYASAALSLLCLWGLMGFCWGALIAELVRLLAEVMVFCFSQKRKEGRNCG